MIALTVMQPYASFIAARADDQMGKDIENRTWPLPRSFVTPQRVYVHAGLKPDGKNYNETKHITGGLMQLLWKLGEAEGHSDVWDTVYLRRQSRANRYGAILGTVEITGCVTESDSPWFGGPYGFTLADPVVFDEPIPYAGKLGFFEVQL